MLKGSMHLQRTILPVALALLVAGCHNIRTAAREGDLDAVQQYIEAGVDVNERSGDGETALHWACRQGHVDVVRFLLEKGADVSEEGTGCGTPLQWAVQAGQREAAVLLLDHGADVNQPGTDEFTALHDAVLGRDLKMAELLLSRGADPHAKASYDRTPLFCVRHYAPDDRIAALLLRHGALEEDTGDMPSGRGAGKE